MDRRKFTQDEKDAAWEKAATIPGYNPDTHRQDQVGNIMYKHSYGKQTPMGYDIDHSKPLSKGGTYHPNNLNAMQSEQNRCDKNDAYPYPRSEASPVGITRYDDISTTYDKRSSTIKDGSTLLNYDGSIDGRSESVRSGDVLLTKDGMVDKRCSAFKSGRIFEK
ncbi:helicase with zinc finger domain [Acrasis kona]|uniref:Helicase with zinc finger domain n=1 Tax=Acrasis kona TaxID=1008807 RepID=A0AAW2ZGP8_9EUKA